MKALKMLSHSTGFNSRKLFLIVSLLLTFGMSMSILAGPVQFSSTKIVTRDDHTKLTFGPDGHIYGATSEGEVYRYKLKSNGTLEAEERVLAKGEVSSNSPINGITFTPGSTANNLTCIISAINYGTSSGEVYRFKFKPFGQANPIIEKTLLINGIGKNGAGNHAVNDVLFGNDGLLYIAMAGQHHAGIETLKHTAALVQVDLSHSAFNNTPVNIKTLFENVNDLYSTNLPIRLYATGLRNAGGLHLHSNGNFYATVHDPPDSYTTLYPDGSQKGHSYTHIPDLVVKIEKGKYYGHGSPVRGENISYGGNPTSGVDPFEMSGFPVGTLPEPNFDPSLIIKTANHNCIGSLDEFEHNGKKYLLVSYLKISGSLTGRVEWIPLKSNGKFEDEVATKDYVKDGNGNDIVFNGTLDVLVDPNNQNVFVADFGKRSGNYGQNSTGAIYLLKALNTNISPTVSITSPANQAELEVDKTVTINASASDIDGIVANVKFYIDGNLIGTDTSSSPFTQSWTPSAPGTYRLTAIAEDNEGAKKTSAAITVQIDSNSVAPTINSSAITSAFAGTQYSYNVNASGNPAPTYSLTTKPNGMTINANTGIISWTPASSGTYNVTVLAQNGVNPNASQPFSITVADIKDADFPGGNVAQLTGGVEYSYYETIRLYDLPVFSQLEALSNGNLVNFSREPRRRDTDFAFDYSGFVEVPEDGIYTFTTSSNDGSHLYIGNQLIVNNGGAHAVESKSGSISLRAGKHAIRVAYYNNAGPTTHTLSVLYSGPGINGTTAIPDSALFRYSNSYGMNEASQANAYLNMPETESGIIPATLSRTGAFTDTANFVLADGAVPFDVINPLWSDGANKDRWFFIPAGKKITFAESGQWVFPEGSVLVKHFALGNEKKRVETRLNVVKADGSIYGFTYRWRNDNSDADLVTEAVTASVSFDGKNQDWYYPSPQDCLTCHTQPSGYILGPNTRQLNRDFHYMSTGKTDNQLRTLNKLNLLSPKIDEVKIQSMEKMVSLSDENASLEDKVRSYLDSNCSHCHRPSGVNGATWDGRFEIPISEKGLIGELATNNLGIEGLRIVHSGDEAQSAIFKRMNSLETGIAMPPLAKNQVDQSAIKVISDWINSLSSDNEEENIALGKTASQSSTTHGGLASRAVDGNSNGIWKKGSITHTAAGIGQWWEVDLGATYTISSMKIFNRTDSVTLSQRLSNFTVSLFKADIKVDEVTFTSYPDPSTMINSLSGVGDRVRVTQNLNQPLSIAEFQIFGIEYLNPVEQVISDIGNVGFETLAAKDGNSYLISASGKDIWGNSDAFGFIHENVEDGTEVSAKIESIENTNAWAKAGVMIRESLNVNSKHAMVVVTPSKGVSFQRRVSTGGSSSHTTLSGIKAPEWAKIRRDGNLFTGYFSSDNQVWYPINSITIDMASKVKAGLAVTSHDNSKEAEALISNFSIKKTNEESSLVRFILRAADTKQDIREIFHNETINLATDGTKFNIRAISNGPMASVVFYRDGVKYNTEHAAPYYMELEAGTGQWSPAVGTYTIMATPYSENNGGGIAGKSLAIVINVVNKP